jgi:hypothetical protein
MAARSALTHAGSAALVACIAAGCHGGGDTPAANPGTAGQQFIVTPTNIGFVAANNTSSPTPPSRNVTATVSGPAGGTLFARLVITGDAVDIANSSVQILNPTQARITIRPVSPTSLGVGNHASIITLIACNTDPSCSGPQIGGSPATINVAYQVGVPTPPPESLAPSVGAASVAGNVVLRGTGFASVTSVSFGATPAVDFTAMSDTEIRATYPALAAGTLAISLSSGVGPVAFGQSLTLVPAGTLAAATLAYPTPPQNMRGLAFDPVTQTLFVGAGFSTPTNNQVVSYTLAAGVWQLNPPATVANLRNLALSLDRARLVTLTDTSIIELSPTSLVLQATTVPNNVNTTVPDAFLKGIVVTNDGQAFITSSSPTSTGRHWLYTVAGPAAPHTITGPFNSYTFPETGGPDNGTRAVLVQGGAAQPIQQYNAFTGQIGQIIPTQVALSHSHPVTGRVENINLPEFDRNGTRMLVAAFNGGAFHAVYDANFAELGRVPSGDLTATNAAYAISPDATRAYILQVGAGICRVRAFDIRTPPGAGAQYQEVTTTGFPINLSPNCPSSAFDTPTRILLNPPGDTLFIAGDRLIRVARLPG